MTRKLYHQTRTFLLQRIARVPWAWHSTPALFDTLHLTATKAIPSFARLAIVRGTSTPSRMSIFDSGLISPDAHPVAAVAASSPLSTLMGSVLALWLLRTSPPFMVGAFPLSQILQPHLTAFYPLLPTLRFPLPSPLLGLLGAKSPPPLLTSCQFRYAAPAFCATKGTTQSNTGSSSAR